MGLLAGFFLLNLAPVLSFYLLLIREPNPDAAIEVAYFACVSVGFLVPFAVMRFYSLFGLAVEAVACLPGQRSGSSAAATRCGF